MDQYGESTIRISHAELQCLRAFTIPLKVAEKLAVKQARAIDFAGAVIEVTEGTHGLRAYATDGRSCVMAETSGPFELGLHRWWIPRDELDLMVTATKPDAFALLRIEAEGSISHYTLLREVADDEGELHMEDQQTITLTEEVEEDGQMSFPAEQVGNYVTPNEKPVGIISAPFAGRLLMRAGLLESASQGSSVRVHFPAAEGQPLVITAGRDGGTRWSAAIMPHAEEGEKAGEDPPEDPKKPEPLELKPTGKGKAKNGGKKK